MDIKMMNKLKDRLCEELEQVSRKSGNMSITEIDVINKLVIAIEKLMRIEEIDGGGMSQRSYGRGGMWNAEGSYGNHAYNSRNNSYDGSYDDGNSGRHYVTGHYSRAEGTDMLRENLRKMIDDSQFSGNDRRTLERAMEILG